MITMNVLKDGIPNRVHFDEKRVSIISELKRADHNTQITMQHEGQINSLLKTLDTLCQLADEDVVCDITAVDAKTFSLIYLGFNWEATSQYLEFKIV
jgi:hypothetical protein